MQLKDFISNSLFDIQQGVEDAIKRSSAQSSSGTINPHFVTYRTSSTLVQEVKFDIAVTASDKDNDGIKAGINVVGISIGVDGKNISETSVFSRIQFNIPIIPPVTKILTDE